MAANDVPRSARREQATRFGDVSPPRVYRLWSSSVHRVSFCLDVAGEEARGTTGAGYGQAQHRLSARIA